MLTIGSILFIILAVLLGIIVALFYDSYRRSPENPAVKSLWLTFVFIFAYASILALSSILFSHQPLILAWGYNLSLFLGFIAIFSSLDLPIFTSNFRLQKFLPLITWSSALASAIILIIQIVDFRLPIVNPNGVIFWNLNPISAWLTSIFILAFAITWAYLAYDGGRLLDNFRLRWKLYILGINMLALGLSAFFFFPAKNEDTSFVSFILIAPAYLATIIVFLYFRLSSEK
ncbi:MAG: hypothetical protein AAB900_00425 [Patescibacteria group bacterium]